VADLRFEDFSSRVGERFEAQAGDARVGMTLTEATPLKQGIRDAGCFRLEWRGDPSPLLPQGMYPMRAPGGEVHEIFIVPIACDAQGARYEAIFN
jgi:hypothetical protein